MLCYHRGQVYDFEEGPIVLNVGESQKESLDSEIFMNINLTDYPLRDFVE